VDLIGDGQIAEAVQYRTRDWTYGEIVTEHRELSLRVQINEIMYKRRA
jgi:hypothetical protein